MGIGSHCFSVNVIYSGKNEIFDNPFIVVGFNPKNKLLTGYMHGIRTAPGRTDSCKFFFDGTIENNESGNITISEIDYVAASGLKLTAVKTGRAIFSNVNGQRKMRFDNKALPGDCDWILPFTNEEKINIDEKETTINMTDLGKGDWIMVRLVRAKKAYFHSEPDEKSGNKAFLVSGDVMYVYDERPNWYYVKFKGKKKETVGWIKKNDALAGTGN